MHIKEILAAQETTFSFEFFPPKTKKASEALYENIAQLEALRCGVGLVGRSPAAGLQPTSSFSSRHEAACPPPQGGAGRRQGLRPGAANTLRPTCNSTQAADPAYATPTPLLLYHITTWHRILPRRPCQQPIRHLAVRRSLGRNVPLCCR